MFNILITIIYSIKWLNYENIQVKKKDTKPIMYITSVASNAKPLMWNSSELF